MYTMKTVTDRVREIAGKLELKKQLSDEDKIFMKNVLLDYAFKQDTRSAGRLGAAASDDVYLVKKRQKTMSVRMKKLFDALSSVDFEPAEINEQLNKKRIKK